MADGGILRVKGTLNRTRVIGSLLAFILISLGFQNCSQTRLQVETETSLASITVTDGIYYVSVNGSDNNPGTINAPFRTIQKAASVMIPGDKCLIRGGIYRETVIPPVSGTNGKPIQFSNFPGEQVIITGLDPIGGWQRHTGSIYKGDYEAPLDIPYGQVFVDGDLMIEARHPNSGADHMTPNLGAITSAVSKDANNVSALSDFVALNQPVNYWNGAMLWLLGGVPGSGQWHAHSTQIDSSTYGQLFFKWPFGTDPGFRPTPSNKYFIYGTLNALDSPREWYFDRAKKKLYLWLPDSRSPTSHTIEGRTRRYGFDLSNRSWIEVSGLTFFAATLRVQDHNRIFGNTILYPTPFFDPGIGTGPTAMGVEVLGSSNLIEHNEIAYSWGDGVSIAPSGAHFNEISNNVIHDCDWSGTWSSLIKIQPNVPDPSYNTVIRKNTLYRTGRSAIDHGAKILIELNDMSQFGALTYDLGATYSGYVDGQGARITRNWVHDDSRAGSQYNVGIYLDAYHSGFIIDHNVVWNVPFGIYLNQPASNDKVFNNTLWNNSYHSTAVGTDSGNATSNDVVVWNNLASTADWIGTSQASNLAVTEGCFINVTTHDFRLNSSCSAVDAGKTMSDFTNGYFGSAPDVGAYEQGADTSLSNWKAGADWKPSRLQIPVALFQALCGSKPCRSLLPLPVTLHLDGSGSSSVNGSISSYQWDFGDGTTGTGATQQHTFTKPGTYTVSLTVEDTAGQRQYAARSFRVAPGSIAQTIYSVDVNVDPLGTPTQDSILRVGNANVSAGLDTRAFLKFDLSGIDPKVGVLSAKLQLYLESTQAFGAVYLYQVTAGGWTNPLSVPYWYGLGSQIAMVSPQGGALGYYTIDVTSVVQAWLIGSSANYGLSLVGTEGYGYTGKSFVSSRGDSSKAPQLIIVQDSAPP